MTDFRDLLDETIRQLGAPAAFPKFPEFPFSKPFSEPQNAHTDAYAIRPDSNEATRALDPIKGIGNGNSGNSGNRTTIPIAWASAPDLASLDPDKPPRDMPASLWKRYIEDAHAFVASGWLDQARSLGWSIDDLFGADSDKPYARIDKAGFVLLLNGDRVVAISADVAGIETRSGARLTYRRRGSNYTKPIE